MKHPTLHTPRKLLAACLALALLVPPAASHADVTVTPLTSLPNASSVATGDIFPAVVDPTGATQARKVTFGVLFDLMDDATMTLTNKVISGASNTLSNVSWASLVSTPTTLNGYGITDAQPLDSDLTALAGVSTQNFGVSLLSLANASAGRSSLGVVIGTDVQAYDADLAAIAGLADPNADRILFWDDSAGAFTFLAAGTNITITGTTISASGDMLKSTYDPRDLGRISGSTGTTSGMNSGGVGGELDLRGGNANATGAGGYGGQISLYGETATSGAGGHAGSIYMYGDQGQSAGSLDTSGGASGSGGNIYTSNGGGTIDTRGTGSIGLGVGGTRTTLVGSATGNRTVTLPNATTTLVGTDVTQTLTNKTITGPSVTVDDVAYDATSWNGSNLVPTRNAVRDKLEAMQALSGTVLHKTVATTTTASSANSGTNPIPHDNTSPQNTEGVEILTVTHNRKSASSRLIIEFDGFFGQSSEGTLTVALFQDSTASALTSEPITFSANGYMQHGRVRYIIPSTGSTGDTTFKIRFGSNAGTAYFLQSAFVGALYSTSKQANITVTEEVP